MANRYLIKLWILTLVLAPFIYGLLNLIIGVDGQVVTLLEVFPITLLFSFVLSLPTLLIAYLVNKFVTNNKMKLIGLKIINILIAAIGLTLTLLILKGSLMPALIKTYIISLIIAALILETYNRLKTNRIKQKI